MRVTFKTDQPVGRYRSFDSPTHTIKVNGVEVGVICDGVFTIRLMVMKTQEELDSNPKSSNCKWRWVTLAKKSESLQEAKDFVKNNISAITNKFDLIKE